MTAAAPSSSDAPLSPERLSELAKFGLLILLGRWDELRALRSSFDETRVDRALRETVLQASIFAGLPRIVQATGILAGVGGLGTPAPEELERGLPPTELRERGAALFDQIYGRGADAVRGVLDGAHPELGRFVEEHAYGTVLGRPGLCASDRECLAVCWLAALDQERQLASHARGAVRCGAPADRVLTLLRSVRELLESDVFERCESVAQHFARE